MRDGRGGTQVGSNIVKIQTGQARMTTEGLREGISSKAFGSGRRKEMHWRFRVCNKITGEENKLPGIQMQSFSYRTLGVRSWSLLDALAAKFGMRHLQNLISTPGFYEYPAMDAACTPSHSRDIVVEVLVLVNQGKTKGTPQSLCPASLPGY